MHYLIDGHNLIGKMPGINLDDPDDEVKLVLLLRSWAAGGSKRRVTVIFDHGLPGGLEKGLSTGPVKVIFAPAGKTADALLIKRINQARNAQEYTLVSSDLHVVRTAEARRMPVWRAEDFVDRLSQDKNQGAESPPAGETDSPEISAEDVDMWLDLFGTKGNN